MLKYALALRTGESVHETASSTGTADKKTITKPPNANGMFLSAKTTNVRVTFDGTDPGAGVAPGLIIIQGAQPVFFPFATDIEFVSDSAAASELNVLWVEALT
jgi:hypothetical protein